MGVAGRGGAGVRASEEGGEVPGRRRDNGVSAGVGREGEKQWRGRQLEEEFFRRNLRVLGNGGVRGIGPKQNQNRAKTRPKQNQNRAKTCDGYPEHRFGCSGSLFGASYWPFKGLIGDTRPPPSPRWIFSNFQFFFHNSVVSVSCSKTQRQR